MSWESKKWVMTVVYKHLPNKALEVTSPQYVPRKGERIIGWVNPSPTVVDVAYDFDEKKITVIAE